MTERKGLGRVHDGFYGALFHDDQESGVLFDEIVKAIEAADPEGTKALYVTGATRASTNAFPSSVKALKAEQVLIYLLPIIEDPMITAICTIGSTYVSHIFCPHHFTSCLDEARFGLLHV